MACSFESVSTWRQPLPAVTSPARQRLVDAVAATVAARSPARLRVAVDGFTAAGKTTFGHELAAALRALGRPTARASLDDFKHPWRYARERGYDRTSGHGYYRNASDVESAQQLLLRPAGPDGSGLVALCGHDPLTGVDAVFAFRPEYDAFWDYRIWLDVDPALALERGIARDAEAEGLEEATRLHRDRYHVAEGLYLAEVDPGSRADLVIDNNDVGAPQVVHGRDR